MNGPNTPNTTLTSGQCIQNRLFKRNQNALRNLRFFVGQQLCAHFNVKSRSP